MTEEWVGRRGYDCLSSVWGSGIGRQDDPTAMEGRGYDIIAAAYKK